MINAQLLTIFYRNHRGETAVRRVRPIYAWFGSTEWHPDEQWLINVFDAEKNAYRDYALGDFLGTPALDESDVPTTPPGHTCPAIDRVLRCIRRAEWRMRADGYAGTSDPSALALLAEARAALETVRDENRQMRAAFHAGKKP